MCRVTLSSCEVVFFTTYAHGLKKMTKKGRKLMEFKNLQENYTKVSFLKSSQPIIEKVSTPSIYKKTFKNLVPVVVMGTVIYFNMEDIAFASNFTKRAERFYFDTFMMLAKWVIVVKGGWDIVSKTLKEDFEGAKKCIVQYMVVFVTLMGLPHALNFVEDFFKEGI